MSFDKLTIHRYLSECLAQNADFIIVKSKRDNYAEVHPYVHDASGPKKIHFDSSALQVSFQEIENYIELFSLSPSEMREGFAKYALEARNILIETPNGIVIGKISKQQNRDQEVTFQITFVKTNIGSLSEAFAMPLEISILMQKINKEKKGIILLNNTDTYSAIVLSQMLQYPLFFDIKSLTQHWEDALNPSTIVVLMHQFEDPVDGFLHFVEKAKQGNVLENALNRLEASVILKSLRKQCGVCAKPTTISGESKQKFPDYFRSRIPDTYQFSRGCTQCGYTSFKGITFIESIFTVSDQLKSAMKLNVDPQTAYREFFAKKNASIYDNAINQMIEGKVSVEEVTRSLPPISNAWNDFLISDKTLQPLVRPTAQVKAGQKSILIVEDDENQREVLKVVFINEGYDVLTAQNGKEAISVMAENRVNIILSDLMMPEMNGLELLSYCKKDAKLKSIPVMVLTASSNPDHELKLLEEGADDYCPKNVKKKVLLKRVENIIERTGQNINPVSHFLKD